MENETYTTLTFKSKKIACNNLKNIKDYFSARIVTIEMLHGTDERGNTGYYVSYSLTPNT